MRNLITFLLLCGCSALAADLYVPVNTMLGTSVTNRKVTVTSTDRRHRNSGTALISPESVTQYTGTDGTTTFTNLMWGNYRLDLQGTPSGTWAFSLDDTNIVVDVTTLIGSTTVPGAATNFYTAAQSDARYAPRGAVVANVWTDEDGITIWEVE